MDIVTPEAILLAARALVLHDLEVTGVASPHTVSLLEEAVSTRRWWASQWAEGLTYVAGLVAQDVQDALLDTRGRWPVCPVCGRDDAATARDATDGDATDGDATDGDATDGDAAPEGYGGAADVDGNAHALYIHPELGGPDPTWVCESAGVLVAPLGHLPPR